MQKSSVVNLFAAGFLTLLYGIFLLDTRWGLGFPILNTLLLGFILWQRPDIRKNKLSLTFIVLSLLLSSFLALRSFIPGQIITLLTIFILNSLLVTKGETNNPLTFKTLFLSPLYIIWNTLRQPIKQINNLISVFGKDNQTLKVIIKGSLIGIPIACLFIWLFVMADPLFEKHYLNLVNSFKFDFWLIKKVIELYIAAGVILSFIFVTSKSYAEFEFLSKRQHIQKEIAVATVFIAAVIGLFLVVQGEYLFAGEQMLKDMGVMLSEYTRRGYTELLIISTISLGIISVLVKRRENVSAKAVKIISFIFIFEIFLLLVSATRRVYLYQDEFGFTQIRLLGFLFSIWLASILGIFLAILLSLLKEKYILTLGFIAGVSVITLMNFINIDYQVGVVKQPTLGYGTDYNYIARLSPDSYLGWKDVLNNFEQKQSKGECEYEDGKAIFSLTEKLQNLKAQSNNNWHFYGSYVYSDKKALTFLRDNETRLLTIQKNHERCLQQKFIPQPQIQSLPSSLDAPNSPTTNLQ